MPIRGAYRMPSKTVTRSQITESQFFLERKHDEKEVTICKQLNYIIYINIFIYIIYYYKGLKICGFKKTVILLSVTVTALLSFYQGVNERVRKL